MAQKLRNGADLPRGSDTQDSSESNLSLLLLLVAAVADTLSSNLYKRTGRHRQTFFITTYRDSINGWFLPRLGYPPREDGAAK